MPNLFSTPCNMECKFNGPIKPTDSLCLICGMTSAERDDWPLLTASEADAKYVEIQARLETIWLIWELMEEPTLQ